MLVLNDVKVIFGCVLFYDYKFFFIEEIFCVSCYD